MVQLGNMGKIEFTIQERRFIDAYCRCGVISEAEREIGAKRGLGTRLLAKQHIKNEIDRLTLNLQRKTRYTLDKAMADAIEAAAFAKATKNAAALVKAIEHKAKLNGLLIDRHDVRSMAMFSINVTGITRGGSDVPDLPALMPPPAETTAIEPAIETSTETATETVEAEFKEESVFDDEPSVFDDENVLS